MLRTKTADRIACVATVVMLIVSVCLWGFVEPVQGNGSHAVGYEDLLFDAGTVHTIDITLADWNNFIKTASAEEYTACDVTIDGERFSNVAIRAKGNTSLSSVSSLGSERYSFKLEFDHFAKGMTYHGLDKISLNNLIQDATMMKDYLAYTLMRRMGVPSPLCSYVQINVNGEAWGLYLAVEGVEDAFMDRNGMTKGELYKPDSLSFGGGRGNGRDFDIENFRVKDEESTEAPEDASATPSPETTETPSGMPDMSGFRMPSGMPNMGDFQMPSGMPNMGGFQMPSGMPGMSGFEMPSGSGTDGQDRPGFSSDMGGFGGFGGFNFGMGSDDVKLVYTDDDPESYSNIFNNAKTDISTRDKTRLIESLKKLNAGEDLDGVVDKDEVILYLAVHNFLCNGDSYTGMMVHNYYLYEEKGQLSIIPWDYNLAFGGFSASENASSVINSPIDSPVSSGTTDSRPLIAWIFNDESALEAYHTAYDRFITENIESGWLDAEIVRVQEMITPWLEKDESAFYSMDEFEKAVETLRTYCSKRGESVRGQLDGTIPSTSEGQRADSSAMVDAGDISIADMGSMNTGSSSGGGMGGGFGGGFQMPSGGPDTSTGDGSQTPSGDGSQMPSGFPGGDGSQMPSGFPGGDSSQMPSGFPGGDGSQMPSGFPGGDGSQMPSAEPDASQEPSVTEQPAATDQPSDTDRSAAEETASPEPRGERERPSGFPGGDFSGGSFPGGDFPGSAQQGSRTGWIWLAGCLAGLLAAFLIISRFRGHND